MSRTCDQFLIAKFGTIDSKIEVCDKEAPPFDAAAALTTFPVIAYVTNEHSLRTLLHEHKEPLSHAD